MASPAMSSAASTRPAKPSANVTSPVRSEARRWLAATAASWSFRVLNCLRSASTRSLPPPPASISWAARRSELLFAITGVVQPRTYPVTPARAGPPGRAGPGSRR